MTKHLNIVVGILVYLAFLCGCKPVPDKNIEEAAVADQKKEEAFFKDVFMPVGAYVKWVQDPENGLRKEKTIDELHFAVQYKPHEYIVCMEERVAEINDTLLRSKMSEMEGVQYYDLKITLIGQEGELLKHKVSSTTDYNERVKYFAFQMQQDIQLVEGTDTLSCLLYHFERTYDVAPFCTILLGFNSNNKNIGKQKTLLVYDRSFNKGLLKFMFKENKLLTLPKPETI